MNLQMKSYAGFFFKNSPLILIDCYFWIQNYSTGRSLILEKRTTIDKKKIKNLLLI